MRAPPRRSADPERRIAVADSTEPAPGRYARKRIDTCGCGLSAGRHAGGRIEGIAGMACPVVDPLPAVGGGRRLGPNIRADLSARVAHGGVRPTFTLTRAIRTSRRRPAPGEMQGPAPEPTRALFVARSVHPVLVDAARPPANGRCESRPARRIGSRRRAGVAPRSRDRLHADPATPRPCRAGDLATPTGQSRQRRTSRSTAPLL